MKLEDSINLLRQFDREIQDMAGSTWDSSDFNSWQHRTRSVLARALGESHHITQGFIKISWSADMYSGIPERDRNSDIQAFANASTQARGLIDAAIFELEQFQQSTDVAEDAGFDVELWNHVQGHVVAEEWTKVASQTAIFTEDRIRKWAGRPATEVGEGLMTAVFGERGDYRLGITSGEKNGWHRLAMGISMATRNVDAHRIQDRPDIKQYAIGVLGASSLLLAQIRYEHGNRFHDTSPAGPEVD
jgi:hypothetical protein